jgi:(+)-neomenthol dehydrogenase
MHVCIILRSAQILSFNSSACTDVNICRIAVVTGGNKGIGLEICRQLGCDKGIIVILTSRDEKRGNKALDDLKMSGFVNIIYHQLDVMDSASISSLADFVKTQFGKLDILVNNAGVTGVIVDEESFHSLQLQSGDDVGSNSQVGQKVAIQTYETAKECIKTNYFGPKLLIQALIPLLLDSNCARIVNISSKLGQLKEFYNQWVVNLLSDVDELNDEKIDEFVNIFLKDVEEDLLEKNGWPNVLSAYKVSKAALNAHTRILAKKFPNMSINAITPGFVKTDMSFYKGNISVEEAAKGPLMLALMSNGGPSGCFFVKMNASNF